jgi:hypothetical protein
VQRNQVEDRGGADARSLRRKHPVGEVEDVEASDESFHVHAAKTAPGRAQRVGRGRHDQEPALELEAVERGLDHAPTSRPRDRERDGLDVVSRRGEAAQHSEQVVADSGPLNRERGDIDDDSHDGGDDNRPI